MGIHLYCIAPAGHEPLAGLTGLEGRRVSGLDVRAFTLWISELEDRPDSSVERLREHNEVVWAAMSEDVTPLPIRFGHWHRSTEELAARIAEREEKYGEWLNELAGTVEFGLRVLEPDGEKATPARPASGDLRPSGTEYLRSLARRQAEHEAARERADRLAEELRNRMEGLIVRQRADPISGSPGFLILAHLVRRRRVASYLRGRERLTGQFEGLRFVTSGPWPPYSFVE